MSSAHTCYSLSIIFLFSIYFAYLFYFCLRTAWRFAAVATPLAFLVSSVLSVRYSFFKSSRPPVLELQMSESAIVALGLMGASAALPVVHDWESLLMLGTYVWTLWIALQLLAWVMHVLVSVVAVCVCSESEPEEHAGGRNV
eukprot:TRINITY_DN2618_c0_g1_i3.p1 TRINITY_DN2618_c0_g1~~TRINITY_DN2618_c0_g1_i3.p1  ORF type:complete len:142 (+),score=11.71 TRINITY_DN2618_c0_g1_i3:23-448(+)